MFGESDDHIRGRDKLVDLLTIWLTVATAITRAIGRGQRKQTRPFNGQISSNIDGII
jgi:hypothetical protein